MVAIAASPCPGSGKAFARARFNLPYKDMILSAIGALKDPRGSSLKAISGFISENYSDLPPSHDALVAYHLRRLGSNGEIIMLEDSYKLPLTTETGNNGVTLGLKRRGRPPKNVHQAMHAGVDAGRRRGRPPKPRVDAEATIKRKPGRPPKTSDPEAATTAASSPVYVLPQDDQLKSALLQIFRRATAIILPEGILNEKSVKAPVLILPTEAQALDDATKVKRKPGRPIKVEEKKMPCGLISGEKRKPGRPKKNPSSQIQGILYAGVGKRKPGRPKKIVSTVLPQIIATRSPMTVRRTGHQTSPKSIQANLETSGLVEKKRRVGRPRKIIIG